MGVEDWRKTEKAWEHSRNDVRWMQVGRGEEQPTAKTTYCSCLVYGFAFHMLAWLKLPILTGKKLDSSLVLTYQPLLSFSHLPHMMNAPSLPLFSPVFHSCVLLWLQTEGKTGEDWKSSYFAIVLKKCTFQITGLFLCRACFVVKCD